MNAITPKNTLLFVHIITHFKEIIRVARVLKKDDKYNPVVIFITKYTGWEKDYKQCQLEQIECITYFKDKVQKQGLLSKLKRCFGFFMNESIRVNVKNVLVLAFNILLFLFILLGVLFKSKPVKNIRQKLSIVSRTLLSPFKSTLKAFLRLKVIRKIVGFVLYFFKSCFRFLKPSLWAALFINAYKFLWKYTPQVFSGISKEAHKFYHNFPKILQEHQIQLIIFPEHNLFYFTQIASYIGQKQNIPSVIVPYTIANTKEWSEAFSQNPKRPGLKNRLNKIFAFAFPNWVHVYKDQVLFLPIELVLIHEMFQITPSNPWLLNSGAIDFIASESKAMNDYYIAAGIEQKLLRTTGALYNDELYHRLITKEENRKKLYQSLDLSDDKPMLLWAVPPDQFAGRKESIEFYNYKNALEFVLKELTLYSEQYHIIINLHPRIMPESVNFIKNYPVKLFQGDIAEIIPLCALYVATCSATIRMANSCGIPVINYDLYRYKYDDYINLEGVLTLFDKTEFSEVLSKLIENKSFYEEVCSRQKKQSSYWGTLDGQAGNTLIKELNLLFDLRQINSRLGLVP